MEKISRIITLIVLSGAIAFQYLYIYNISQASTSINLDVLPINIEDYYGVNQKFEDDLVYEFIGAETTLLRRYTKAQATIHLYIGYYPEVKEGKRPHAVKSCYTGQGWDILEDGKVVLEDKVGRKFKTTRMRIKNGNAKQIVYYWFQNEANTYTSEFETNISLFLNKIMFKKGDIAFIRISANIEENFNNADLEIEGFITEIKPYIDNALRI